MNAPATMSENDFRMKVDLSVLSGGASMTELAELYCVGAMMLGHEQAEDGLRRLSPGDFATFHLRVTFEAIGRIVAQKRPADSITVFDELKRSGKGPDFPGENPAKVLGDAMTFCVGGNHFDHFAGLVKDHAARREMARLIRSMGAELSQAGGGNNGEAEWTSRPASEIAVEYSQKIAEAGENGTTSEMISMTQAANNAANVIDEYHRPKTIGEAAGRGITTGIRSIDEVIPSIEAGELVIVAARPGCGKSSLMLQIGRNVAATGGRVLFFSLEMPHEQLAIRMISMTSGVSLSAIRGQRKLNDEEADKVFRAKETIVSLPIHFSDRRGLSASEIALEIKRATRRHGKPALVLVDYLQLIKPENTRDNRNYQLGQTTKILRNVAGDIGTPIIAGAQLNRQVEGRNDKPRLSDLRDSGEVEQDADIVAFLHPNMQTANQPIQNVDLVISKQRNGPLADVPLQFVRSLTKFIEPSVQY